MKICPPHLSAAFLGGVSAFSIATDGGNPVADWQNRIVGEGMVPGDQLLANPRNWRIHPKHQQDAMTGVLNEIGWIQRVIVNRRTGHVIDGHMRAQLAISKGELVPVSYVDLSDEEEAMALATFDPIGAMAAKDDELWDELTADIAEADAEFAAIVAQMEADVARETGAATPALVPDDPGAKVGRAHELQLHWQVVRGDVWQIGPHRLLCGDSTSETDVASLMAGELAQMVFADPPYGVAIGEKNRYLNSIAPSNRIEEDLTNDTLSEAELTEMVRTSFDCVRAACSPGASWYVAAPAGPLHLRFGEVLRDMRIYRQTLIWVKNNATFAPLGVSYHWAHEPIFYGWLPNGPHTWLGDRKQTTVWYIDRPSHSPEHPTMKPVELVARTIEHSAPLGALVVDPFLGSGTTMVAAAQLERRCFGLEIDPKYCAVILDRMTGMGFQPERINAPEGIAV